MGYTAEAIAEQVWLRTPRTVDGLVPSPGPGRLNQIAYAVWTAANRTVSGGTTVTGTASLELQRLQLQAAGIQTASGTAGLELARLEAIGAGVQVASGMTSLELARLLMDAAGLVTALDVTGTATLELGRIELGATGLVATSGVTGTVAMALARAQVASVGAIQRRQGFYLLSKMVLSGRMKLANEFEMTNALITPLGGYAVKMNNTSGSTMAKGSAVSASPTTAGSMVLQSVEYDVIGILYADTSTGEAGWVIMSGVAEALLKDSTGAIKGYWTKAADTDGRIVVTTAPSGIGAVSSAEHFKEVGHCIADATAGTDVLVKIVVHPL